MSGNDRRVSRTRTTLLASFNRLLFQDGFENVSVRALTADADVGRSTFYEHFDGKDDLLEHSIARVIGPLAASASASLPSAGLVDLFEHMLAVRAFVRRLLQGSSRATLVRVLASQLEPELATLARRREAAPIAALPLLALSLAYAQVGCVEAWLDGEDPAEVQVAARVLQATTRAWISAAFGSR